MKSAYGTAPLSFGLTVHLSKKTRLLNACRSIFKHPAAEKGLRRVTRGARIDSFVGKVIPRSYLYPPRTLRSFDLYGFHWDDLDISDAIQWYLYFGLYDPSHESLLSLCRPGDTVLDVGANIGVTALRMARVVGPNGRIHAFEPDPVSFTKCSSLCAANGVTNVEAHRLAISDRSGDVFLSVQDPHNLGMNRLGPEGERVTATSVDEFARARGLERVDLIKIDVEGHESSVLEGARGIIERCHPRLFVEFDDAALQAHGKSGEKVFSFLKQAGYAIQDTEGKRLDPFRSPSNVHMDLVCTREPVADGLLHGS